jgi:Holliday junction resolvase RusA-like endonuclease
VITLKADINPVAWKAPTLGVKRFGGKVVPYAAPNAEVQAYQAALQEQMRPQYDGEPITGPVHLEWEFCRQQSRYQTESGRWVTKHAQDGTNLQKSSEDALQPWLIKNDVQVQSWTGVVVAQGPDVENPYVLVRVVLL